MYRFALRPRWLLSHLLVAGLVVLMISLGFWQLRRLDDKRDFNALVRARAAAPAAPIDGVLAADATDDEGEAVAYRHVEATGEYDADAEVIVRNRSLDGQPGAWVLTPLVTADGVAVVVNRGFFADPGAPERAPSSTAPASGEVTVSGLLLAGQHRGSIGPRDPAEGTLTALARADIDRLQQQVPYDLYPAYVQLETQEPAADDGLVPLGLPDLTEGPHLSYAVQWFSFSAIAVIGYPIILRRAARRRD